MKPVDMMICLPQRAAHGPETATGQCTACCMAVPPQAGIANPCRLHSEPAHTPRLALAAQLPAACVRHVGDTAAQSEIRCPVPRRLATAASNSVGRHSSSRKHEVMRTTCCVVRVPGPGPDSTHAPCRLLTGAAPPRLLATPCCAALQHHGACAGWWYREQTRADRCCSAWCLCAQCDIRRHLVTGWLTFARNGRARCSAVPRSAGCTLRLRHPRRRWQRLSRQGCTPDTKSKPP